MLNAIFERYDIFLFVFARMTGFVMFNPVFGRRNIPVMVRGALSFVLAVTALMSITADPELDALQSVAISNMLVFIILLVKEFIFGYLMGLVVNIFFAVVVLGGEIMDLQIGLAMSQLFDPASNIQMPLSGNFQNIAFMLMFFLTNAHITLTGIIFLSFGMSPVGTLYFNSDVGSYLMKMFADMFILSMKLAFPIIAAQLTMEIGTGILMRAVPQINIFVVGLQLKILVGIFVMLVCAPISVWFFDGILASMNDSAFEALRILTG
jgi:flagellar biosynthetic protein FliR